MGLFGCQRFHVLKLGLQHEYQVFRRVYSNTGLMTRQINIKTIPFLYHAKNLRAHGPMTDIKKILLPDYNQKRGQVINQKNINANQKGKVVAYLRMCLRICSPPPLRNSHNSREGPVKKNMNRCDILHLLNTLIYVISVVLINKIGYIIEYILNLIQLRNV